MRNLLCADFARLKKDRFFWLGMIVMFCAGVFISINHWYHMRQDQIPGASLDNIYFGYSLFIGVLCAVFCSLFIGTEYSDGVIRNKLIVGHTRAGIYLSNLLVSVAAALLMCLSYLLAVSAVGIPLLGWIHADGKSLSLILLGSVAMVWADCALCTLLSMLNQNKAVVAVIAILGIFIMQFTGSFLNARLNEPKYYSDMTFLTTGGKMTEEMVPNPYYLSGTKRAVCQFAVDTLPPAQGLSYANGKLDHFRRMLPASVLITVISSGVGLWTFRRKNIK